MNIDLDALVIKCGAHSSPKDGLCLLEAAAFMAGEKHSDHPACVDVAIAAFGRKLNDRIYDDAIRTRLLKPLLPKMLNTRGSRDLAKRRAYIAADFAVREAVPMGMDATAAYYDKRSNAKGAELVRGFAAELRAVPEIVDDASARHAESVARSVRERARAADAAAAYAAAYAAEAAAEAAADVAAYAAAYAAAEAAADASSRCLPFYEAAVRCMERMIACEEAP